MKHKLGFQCLVAQLLRKCPNKKTKYGKKNLLESGKLSISVVNVSVIVKIKNEDKNKKNLSFIIKHFWSLRNGHGIGTLFFVCGLSGYSSAAFSYKPVSN